MGSKAIVLLGLFLAVFFLISSEVAARDLAETSNDVDISKETNGVVEDAANINDHDHGSYGGKYGGGRGNYGGGHGKGGGGRGNYGGGHGKGGGYCHHGRCCYRGGCRCCSFAGEKADAEP